jgi:hypothetical protein
MPKSSELLTDQQPLDLGREIENDPTCHGMERGEGDQRRPLTNMEMFAILRWADAKEQQP